MDKNKDLTLVIMAAGMGSRFGGLKQIEPFGPNGEFIIDYSIYDAIRAGFTKVVFIIKKENEQIFKETVGERVEKYIDVSYVFQDIENLPIAIDLSSREKPLGTGHAIYCCKDYVSTPFVIINSDDFYGRDSFLKMAEYLRNNSNEDEYGIMGFRVCNTLTDNGSVKRGVCEVKNGYLNSIVESSIDRDGDKIIATPLGDTESFEIQKNTFVSMNFWGLYPKFFSYLEDKMKEFLEDDSVDLLKDEIYIPNILRDGIRDGFCSVRVLETDSVWYGVTYKEDKDDVIRGIRAMIDEGIYPQKLWD